MPILDRARPSNNFLNHAILVSTMLDIALFRENPQAIKDNLNKRFQKEKIPLVDEVVKLDEEWKKLKKQVDDLRAKRNKLSQEINQAKKEGKDPGPILEKVKAIPFLIDKKEEKSALLRKKMVERMLRIPNQVLTSAPVGKDASQNVVRSTHGRATKKNFAVLSHVELCEQLGIADFEKSAEVAGKGFYYLKGDLVLLNQALLRFALDFMVKKGFLPIEPPLMTRRDIVDSCVDMTFFEEIIYKVEDEDQYLISTSEHPLLGLYLNETLEETALPVRLCGISPCFRKEIGAHGIDEKGLFRTHQFFKVEQVVVCAPEESEKRYGELLQNSIALFTALGIPTRVVESCTGDLGELKAKGADVEAWSPRKQDYIEVCSVSNMTDAQARRLGIRVRKGKDKYVPHTLNNTAIATSRAMVAILENYQNKDGTVTIPQALVPYMNGKKKIEKRKP